MSYYSDVSLNQIETMRMKMIALADEKGHTHEDTVVASQLLDKLLNEYNKVKERIKD